MVLARAALVVKQWKKEGMMLQQPIADRNSTKPDHGKGVQSAVKENAGPLNVYRIWILICIWK
jgi:cellobiose phosphorylase